MIVGSGFLARAFAAQFANAPNVWIYAAGVSNSGCSDSGEFARERARLSDALRGGKEGEAFVYFSTCSIGDPAATNSPYVRHKIDMERVVARHCRFLIIRLPQVAGRTPNPHTLLNYLYARVVRSEKFTVWTEATRNIIDIDDVVAIVTKILDNPELRCITVNVANSINYSVNEIVATMEKVVGKRAVTDRVELGSAYEIDTSQIARIIQDMGLVCDDRYLERVINKYYGPERRG
jgi:nucleoside-diphosphate-sugar epimerase